MINIVNKLFKSLKTDTIKNYSKFVQDVNDLEVVVSKMNGLE